MKSAAAPVGEAGLQRVHAHSDCIVTPLFSELLLPVMQPAFFGRAAWLAVPGCRIGPAAPGLWMLCPQGAIERRSPSRSPAPSPRPDRPPLLRRGGGPRQAARW